MRARNIKPGLFKNEVLGTADPLLTILFEGLWCLADRDGRLEDRPLRIKAEVFPYREALDADGYLTQLARLGFIERYKSGALALIQVTNFNRHQNPHKTEKPGIFPAHDSSTLDNGEATFKQPLDNGAATVEPPLENGSRPADSLIPDSLIPDSSNTDSQAAPSTALRTVGKKSSPKSKPKQRTNGLKDFSPDTCEVVNTLKPIWPQADIVDGRKVRVDRAAFAGRVDELLREPEVTAALLIAAAKMYIADKPQRFKSPQTFFGPGNGTQSPWLDYANMARHEIKRAQNDPQRTLEEATQ